MPDIFVADDSGGEHHHRPVTEYSTVMAGEEPSRNPLSAFLVRPRRVRFETQEKKEEVLLLLRRHFITNIGWIILALVGIVLPIVAVSLFGFDGIPPKFQVIGLVVWYLLVAGYTWESFLDWYFNVYIVTDERIIDIDFFSLIYKKVAAAKIENIQDVTFTQGGVARAFFDFGTVYIQTAGEKREFDFTDVPQPRKVALFLNEMYLEEEKEKIEGRVR